MKQYNYNATGIGSSTPDDLAGSAVELLKELISIPSFSREEDQAAGALCRFIGSRNIPHTRIGNNVFAVNKNFDPSRSTILLNSHHDTVKPNPQYRRNPFEPQIDDGKLYGLGSNDAGGCLVSLLAAFLHFYSQPLGFNLLFAATAEEEISGSGGVEALLPHLPPIDCAIVGEPTLLQMAIAERGLMVIDCIATGKAGHAARNEGINAVYEAMKDIFWMQNFEFEKVSDLLGPTRLSVTMIETENKAHNVVPATCKFVADVRVNELYSFEEVLDTIRKHIKSEIKPRSVRLRSTIIPVEHPLVQAGLSLGKTYYGSPTTSDKALMPFPALKMGPGDSARSHTADEYIYVNEIKEGIDTYIRLLEKMPGSSKRNA